MARTIRQWQREVVALLEREGCDSIRIEPCGSTHQRVTARRGEVSIHLTISASPSSPKAGLRVRSNIRQQIRGEPNATA